MISRERVPVEFVEIPVLQVKRGLQPAAKRVGEEDIFEVEGRPDVKFKVSGGGEECEFILQDFKRTDVSKLRRIMYSSLEVMAIELVEILENETDFLDEMIAHRLGFVPIRCEGVEDVPLISDTEDIEEETTEGIPFSMNVTNTTRVEDFQSMKVPELVAYLRANNVRVLTSDKRRDLVRKALLASKEDVTEADIDIEEKRYLVRKAFLVSKENVTEADINIEDPRCKTVTSGTPIFFLRPGQYFELQGLIQKGVGSLHAKWIPVAKVTFEHNEDENLYILKIFTTGVLTCREIITQALEILDEQ